ncbi:TonB-dependent receptor [Thioalkalivibrio sp. XN279]|uniref:TonB-dependent receptor n=1 Tax=Thioalkalivibrio sp. XN279 TaxID=2714953 RepID=UPI00140E6AC2|nr:TonB-dependent receptor [Thioalkalivibrio sp. XN279]NHA13519.1 TonB-dependent receptor [Thioalkalivibrio sp. XN279]
MRNNQLRLAVRGALAAGAVATAVAAPTAFAQEEAADLERVQVTGSRIKRTDIEGALPVTVIDRETIELSGETSVADLLRNQPINSAGSFRPQSGSTGQSFGGLSLRALGEGRTLILIDGRRAPIAPNIGQGQDLNTIPLAAVERIEILSDGASAIYGTDAIGGVVNIITRKDFTGAQISAGKGNPTREGGDTEDASVIFGASSANGQIMAGASYNKRDIVFQRDREWSTGGASIFSNNFFDTDFNFLNQPDVGSANVAGCDGAGFFTSNLGTNGGALGNELGRCLYDFTLQAADEAEVENQSIFSRARYDINMDWSVYGNFSVSRVKSFGRYAPVPSSPWLVGGFGAIVLPAGSPNHPGTAPEDGGLNPNWQDYQDPIFINIAVLDEEGDPVRDEDGNIVTESVLQYAGPGDDLLLTHRFAANGPRDTTTDGNVYDIDVGVTGRIMDWDIEAGVRRVESTYMELGRNYIVSALAQPVFDAGDYNIYDPFNVPQEALQSFTATINRDARTVSREVYALASTDLFEMAAGPVGFAFGAEYRDEDYRDIFDDLQANGNITGSAGNSAFGNRDQNAVFAEALVPVTDDFEVTIAGRYDDYSDFGSEFSPKLAFRWQPMDEVTMRGSWGQGFRAPTLDLLSQQPAFSADSVRDPATCVALGQASTCQVQINGFTIANPNLGAETSDQYSFGVAFEPLEWLNGSLDYWSISIEDRVANIAAQTIVNCINGTTQNCPPGLSLLDPNASPPVVSAGLGLARNAEGRILYLQRGPASLGTIDASGLDLQLRTNFDFGQYGRLTNELLANYYLTYEVDSGDDVAGEAGLPEWRAVLRNVWTWGDFNVAYNLNYIGSQDSALSSALDGLPSWTTHDIQVNYFTPWDGRVTVGVDNIGDKDPVVDPGESRGYNNSLYDPYGRIVYVRYTQNF